MIKPRLLRLAQLSRLLLTVTIVQGGMVVLLAIAQAWLLSHVISGVFLGDATLIHVKGLLVALLLIILCRAFCAWGIEISSSALAQRIKSHLRRNILSRILDVGPVFIRSFKTTELTNALSDSLDTLEPYYSQFLPQLFLAILVPASVLIAVGLSDPLSALVLILTGPLIPIFMYLIGKQAELSTARQWKLLNQMSAYFLDVIQGLTTLKLLGRSKQQAQQIAHVSERFRHVTLEVLRITFLSALVLELLSTLSTAVVAVQVGLRLLAGQMTFETALFVLILSPEYYLPLRLLGQRFHSAMSGVAAGDQVFHILDSLPDSNHRPSHFTLSASSIPGITFQNVTYGYPGNNQTALQNVSFFLHPGSVTTLVGPSGAGKSTIASLLLGFIYPDSGHICVEDQDLASMDRNEWLKKVAWLPQHPYLMNASVADNLRLARSTATVEEIRKAACLANADDFIQALPAAYETQVGEGGLRLSAGQAQRLALARIFLKDTSLVILDEPAANLDPGSEQVFLETLQTLRGHCTVLVIAHRLRSAELSDQVLVLDQGCLVQSGLPEVLKQQSGLYQEMIENGSQSSEGIDLFSSPVSADHRQFMDAEGVSQLPKIPSRQLRAPRSPLHFLYSQLIPFWREVSLSVLLGFGVIASSVGLMATSAYLISAAALHPSIAELQVAIVGVRFFGLVRGVLRYFERLISHDVSFRMLGKLRVWFYKALEPLAPARLLDRQGGDLLSHITSDIATLETFYVRSAAPLLVAGLSLIGLLFFFLPFEGFLAVALAGLFLLAGLSIPWLLQRLGDCLGHELVEARARMHAGLVELLQGLPDFMVYDDSRHILDRMLHLGSRYSQLQHRLSSLNGFQFAITGLSAHLGMFLTLIIGAQLVANDSLPGVYLAMLVLAAQTFFEAVQPLALAAQQAGMHKMAASRLLQIASEEPAIKDLPSVLSDHKPAAVGIQSSVVAPSLRINSLSFTYPGESLPALQDVSFEMLPGQRIAIIGPSGAGKTTLLNILLRFWGYDRGEIWLDGIDLRLFDLEEARQHFAVVSQHTYLFNTSLEENLRLANPNATPIQMQLALEQAQLSEFVETLPEGLATALGEHGLRLSAGQRQRLAITRALLQPNHNGKPPILVLDEPTSYLDAITEREILDTLLKISGERSILLVTHSLTGLENFDDILAIKDGRVVEHGSPNKLLKSGSWRRA